MKELGLYFKKLLNTPVIGSSKVIKNVLNDSLKMNSRIPSIAKFKDATYKKRVNTLPIK